MSAPIICSVCGGPADIFAIADGGPCMDCVRARAGAVAANGRCVCGVRKRIPDPEIHRVGSRTWQSCRRCLGTIRQLS
jgi:hypothetical protein